jgi:hypothetical protein
MIEDIARIRAELELHVLPNAERLSKGEVDIGKARPIETVPSRVAKRSRCGLGEASFVEPLLGAMVCATVAERWAADLIRKPVSV